MADSLRQNQVSCCDNLELLANLPDGCCDLVYIDPPFATGDVRRTVAGRHRFEDRWDGGVKAFMAFMHPRLVEIRRVMAEHATLYVHLDWRAAAYVRVQLDTIFGAKNFLNEVIWHYRGGGAAKRWFGRKHDTILVFARSAGRHRFSVLREGEYRTDGLKRDEQGRPYKQTRRGRLYFNADGPALDDVWDIPFLSTVALERTGWPAQKPLALLERIIAASSQPGDLVADFFCGSGTTLVAAAQMGRRYLGCDVLPDAVEIARRRLSVELGSGMQAERPAGVST